MGSNFIEYELDGDLTPVQVAERFMVMRQEQITTYGTDIYNGTFSTLTGIDVFKLNTFNSYTEAFNYLAEHAVKWEKALAVRFKSDPKKLVKQPTFGKQDFVGEGYVCHFITLPELIDALEANEPIPTVRCCVVKAKQYGMSAGTVVPADQLEESRAIRVTHTANSYLQAVEAGKKLNTTFLIQLNELKDIKNHVMLTYGWKEIKQVRKCMVDNLKERVKLARKLLSLSASYSQRLWVYEKNECTEKWLIGGWCAT